jgi:hypothetical protein
MQHIKPVQQGAFAPQVAPDGKQLAPSVQGCIGLLSSGQLAPESALMQLPVQ